MRIRDFGQMASTSCLALLLVALSIAMAACGRQEERPAEKDVTEWGHEIDSAATAIYSLYIEGKYDEYIKQIESNDRKPKNYCEQMALLYKVRHQQQVEENGGPTKCRLVRFEPHGDDCGTAFIEVTCKDKSKETVLQQMVKINGRWRVR